MELILVYAHIERVCLSDTLQGNFDKLPKIAHQSNLYYIIFNQKSKLK